MLPSESNSWPGTPNAEVVKVVSEPTVIRLVPNWNCMPSPRTMAAGLYQLAAASSARATQAPA